MACKATGIAQVIVILEAAPPPPSGVAAGGVALAAASTHSSLAGLEVILFISKDRIML